MIMYGKKYYRVNKKLNIVCVILIVIFLCILVSVIKYDNKQRVASSTAIIETNIDSSDEGDEN